MSQARMKEKRELIHHSIKCINQVNEGTFEGGPQAITQYLQASGNILDKQMRDLLVEIMDDPQLVDGKICTISLMGHTMLEVLAEKIKNCEFITQEQCNHWIVETYVKVFEYIKNFYRVHVSDETHYPPRPHTDLPLKFFDVLEAVIRRPEDGMRKERLWNEPWEPDVCINLEKTRLSKKHISRVLGFFHEGEEMLSHRGVYNEVKVGFVQAAKKKIDRYAKKGELNKEQATEISAAITKCAGPF